MADPNRKPAALSNYALDQTILFLRPITADAILDVNAKQNDRYRFEVAPSEEPTDPLVEEAPVIEKISEVTPQSHTPVNTAPLERSRAAPDVHPFALRLGFDTIENPSRNGFTVGGVGCHINLPTLEPECYFVINYIMKSGALMITARIPILVEKTILRCENSLLLMHGSRIRCNKQIKFLVEFPDIHDCAQSHKANYQTYSARFGFENAQYLPTSLDNPLFVGPLKSVGILGEGAFGVVHKAVHKHTGALFAMKILRGKVSDYKEVQILQKLQHNHIIHYETAFTLENKQLCVIMELAVNDLFAHIQARRENGLSLDCIRSIARQAISALEYLHNENVTHRDLKLSNILVTNWSQISDILTIKLADFGLASYHTRHHTICGTESYMAPEIEEEQREENGRLTLPYTNAVDIWAMGKILLILLRDSKISSTCRRNQQGGSKSSKTQDIRPAMNLIREMMSLKAEHRPTAAQCLESPWLRPEESFSNPVAQKRKASPDPINHRAMGPGP